MNIEETIDLEKALLTPRVRSSKDDLDHLLADDFFEVGASGDRFGKEFVLEHLPAELDSTQFIGRDFKVREIFAGVALVTFIVTKHDKNGTKDSFRSSLWVWRNDRWQMTYHQGTPLP